MVVDFRGEQRCVVTTFDYKTIPYVSVQPTLCVENNLNECVRVCVWGVGCQWVAECARVHTYMRVCMPASIHTYMPFIAFVLEDKSSKSSNRAEECSFRV